MPRLIDADALKSYIDGEISMSREEREDADAKDDALGMAHNNGEIQEARRIKRYIEKHAPTIDAEPVVRCKDCKYFKFGDYCMHDGAMEHSHARENDFCSYGERRESNGQNSTDECEE